MSSDDIVVLDKLDKGYEVHYLISDNEVESKKQIFRECFEALRYGSEFHAEFGIVLGKGWHEI